VSIIKFTMTHKKYMKFYGLIGN